MPLPTIPTEAGKRDTFSGLVEEDGDLIDRRALGDALVLHGVPKMQQTNRSLLGAEVERRAYCRRVKQEQRAPVASKPAGMRAKQNDIGSDRTGEQVLLLLNSISKKLSARKDERGRTVELACRARLVPFCCLRKQSASVWAQHAKAPRVRQVVVRCPAGKLKQLAQCLWVNRLRSKCLVRSTASDSSLKVHGAHTEAILEPFGRLGGLAGEYRPKG